jgi:hypothetical protein
MSRTPDAVPPRRRALSIIAVAAVLILALITGVLSVALLGGDDGLATEPSASASPASSSSTAAAESPRSSIQLSNQSPSTPADASTAAPTPGSDLALPDGLLPPGSLIRITGEGVRIREQPSTDATIATTMSADDLAYVVDSIGAGPIRTGGYDWYLVEYSNGEDIWPWQDIYSGELFRGWMAAGNASERFAELAEVECSTDPVTLERLAFDIKPWDRLVCHADAPITIEGTFGCDTCIEVTPGAAPAWLADASQQPPIAGMYAYYPFIRVALPPDLAPPENRDVVRATLNVDDPAATTCTYTPEPDVPPDVEADPLAVQIFCRERLVLESFEVIGRDEFGN